MRGLRTTASLVLLALAGVACAAPQKTLHQTVRDQAATIQSLEALVARQGALLEKLQAKVEALPPAAAPAPSPAPSPAAVPAPERKAIDALKAPDPLQMTTRYGDNFVSETNDKSHRIFVGGRVQLDAAFAHAPAAVENGPGGVGAVHDAVNVRRARFDIGGTLFTDLDFYTQFDFVNGFNTERNGAPLITSSPVPTDLWMQFKNLPAISNLRVGNQKEGLSFEHLVSSRFLDFMERSSAFDAFVEDQDNGFKLGINTFDCTKDERVTWALGVFRNTKSPFVFNTGDGELAVTGRIAGTPLYRHDGRQLIHLGLGASTRELDDGETRFRTRTLVRNGNNVQHTIVADARLKGDREYRVVPELVVVNGPLTLQAEYYAAGVTNATFPNVGGRFVGDVHFDGYYAQVMYFLTGEHKVYNRKTGAFGRVVPNRNANWGPDTADADPVGGSWMVAYRHGMVDLNDGPVQAGKVVDDTLGINWFLNRDVKIQWNYTVTDRDAPTSPDGTIKSFGTRLAFDY